MLSLPSLQLQMQHAILRGQDRALAAVVAGNGIAAERRIAIHRNHYRLTLVDALAATFPLLRQVVGADFFGQLARGFIQVSPPRSPCLFEYGADLPGFIEALPQARSLPYLADLARFEWAVCTACHAIDASVADLGRLAGLLPEDLGALRLAPHPSLTLLRSAFPLIDIWTVARPDAPAEARADLSTGGVCLAIFRQGDDAVWRRLDEGAFAALSAIASGVPLGQACGSVDAGDLPSILAGIVFAGAFTDPTSGAGSEHVTAR